MKNDGRSNSRELACTLLGACTAPGGNTKALADQGNERGKAQPFRMRGGEGDLTAHATGNSRAEQRKALLLAKDPGAADAVELYIGPKVLLFPPPPRGGVRRYSRFLRACFTATDDRSCSSPPSSMQLVMQSRRGPAPPMSPGRSGWRRRPHALGP